MESWEDGECPWCRSLLGSGRALTVPDAGLRIGRLWHRTDNWPAWWERARPIMLPLAALTVAAALMMALS
ncbi:hypothetical protein ACIO02_25410 [Streptomyces sp. NPDC087568]|uniref:hypothetical protein n=1 Tax=Streptomyces sp. NPDC087568 TaxID=3365799 RepID=UPI003818E4D6